MILLRLALKNLLGAGMRTWLNVIVLSFSFVAIIWLQGFYEGMNEQASQAMMDVEYGGGQYWHQEYDPYDPLSLQEAHAKISGRLKEEVEKGQATPVLIYQGTIYPNGRIRPVLLKGINPGQEVLAFPSQFLAGEETEDVPALIGQRMAESTGLKAGDYVTVRWRDARGAFDARDIHVVQVLKTTVQSIDVGQVWLPLQKLQEMTNLEEEATLVVIGKGQSGFGPAPGWIFKDLTFLLKDLEEMVQSKTIGATIMYTILLALAMLAIFNTQVLSIFRRRKEMGTLMALGMTRAKVIGLFTLEGALHSLLAAAVAALYGIPLLLYSSEKGWAMPEVVDSYGFAIGEKLFPAFSSGLIIGTTVLIVIVTTFVSFLPTRRITKLKPTDALRGKLP